MTPNPATATPTIAAIVEGYGEVAALPVLLRRIAGEVHGTYHIHVPRPFRVNRSLMTRSDELAKAVQFMSARVGAAGGVLVLADADDACAVTLAGELREHAAAAAVEVAVAVREFESWFLAALPSLHDHEAVRSDATFDGDVETPRDAKGAMSAAMRESYRATLHQPAFAAMIDLEMARKRNRSFAHFARCVDRLIAHAVTGEG